MSAPVALVTGAAGGIGAAVVDRLAVDGFDVVAVDLREPPGGALRVTADLTTRAGNRAAVDAAFDRFGRLDAVVANAGVQHVAPIAEFPEEQWDRLLALLLTSPFLLAKYAWPLLTASPQARLIVVASAHSLAASPYKSAYVSAKHGVLGLIKTLALEGADDAIMTSAICPAFVRTPLVEAQIAAQAEAHGLPVERVLDEVILAPHAVKRLIEPSEVADVVAFVAGPGGGAITGTAVPMDMGWTAR